MKNVIPIAIVAAAGIFASAVAHGTPAFWFVVAYALGACGVSVLGIVELNRLDRHE